MPMHVQESSEKLVSSSDAGFSGLLMLQKLEHLTLELRLLSFPSAICHLPSLRSLTLRGAVRLRIPSDITYLTSLTFLDVSSCGMRGIPRAICGLYSARSSGLLICCTVSCGLVLLFVASLR